MPLINFAAHNRAEMIQGAVGFIKKRQAQEAERKKIKLLFFDVETTGLLYYKHAIHQLSGQIVIDNEMKCTFDFRLRPHKVAEIDRKALEKSRVMEEQINSYPEAAEAYTSFVQLLSEYVDKFDKQDKFYMVGYNNAKFDNDFLRNLFTLQGDNYFGSWFWNCSIDVMVLATQKLLGKRSEMAHFDLFSVARYFGIEVDEKRLHEAQYDVEITKEVYERLMINDK